MLMWVFSGQKMIMGFPAPFQCDDVPFVTFNRLRHLIGIV